MITTRELHRRTAASQSQIAAMLLFYVPERGRRPLAPKDLRYQHAQLIRGLLHLSATLDGDRSSDTSCEACGKEIRPGQPYCSGGEDAGPMHAKCAGVDPKRCGRMETANERHIDLRRRLDRAREFLKARGLV